MKNVCVITSTRAEYGLLRPLMRRIKEHPKLTLQLLVTGTHLEKKYGYTAKDILRDGFDLDSRVRIICGEARTDIVNTMARALKLVGKKIADLRPDLIVMDGDRYEYPPIAMAAVALNFPIAHIGGGDVTEGACDDYFRHALTKLSILHFPTNEISRKRIIQMGENPFRVFNAGSIGVENALTMTLLTKDELEKHIRFKVDDRTLLVTYHPVTQETAFQKEQLNALLAALEEKKDLRVIITKPNADTNRDELSKLLDHFFYKNKNRAIVFESMGLKYYLSAMKHCIGVVGNSSSGIIEAPSLKVGSINIGNRQKGRIMADSVINCSPDKTAITEALHKLKDPAYQAALKVVKNPYQGSDTSRRIVEEIACYLRSEGGCKKIFYDLF